MSYKKVREKLNNQYPALEDLARRAKQRLPHVAWEYLETGTGNEYLTKYNRTAFDALRLTPQFCRGELKPDLETNIFGQKYAAPFGMAPVGLTGLMWPRAEILLAESAVRCNIPFSLSTVATETPETLAPHIGNNGWFQLYPPREKHLCADILKRAKDSGFHTLLITADVPVPSRRERTKRAGLRTPPKITPDFVFQALTHPQWTFATLKRGLPKLRTVTSYTEFQDMASVGHFVRSKLGGNLSWEMCEYIKKMWDGPVILKGVMHPSDAQKAIQIGMDGIVVSNHGGRQFDAAPASIEVLPEIVSVVGDRLTVILDSGVRTGADILRALRLGADFVLLGRAFMYGVAALGTYGGDHVFDILKEDLKNNMIQLGIERL